MSTRANLAGSSGLLGGWMRRLRSEQTLSDSERVLGPDHPSTLERGERTSRPPRRRRCGWMRRLRLGQTLSDSERVLGPRLSADLRWCGRTSSTRVACAEAAAVVTWTSDPRVYQLRARAGHSRTPEVA
jgi:hypothetical protein